MMLIVGEIGDVKEFSKHLSEPNESKRVSGHEFIFPAEENKTEAVKLLNREDIWKVNLHLMLDLEKRTVDLRYIQKDEGKALSTVTDDYGMLERAIQDKERLAEMLEKHREEIG